MAAIYFPSCKFSAAFPESSKKIQKYLKERHGMEIAGCCRKSRLSLTEKDTAIFICHTCMAICEESSNVGKTLSLWELLNNDIDFKLPDYGGMKLTVQDCWRSFDRKNEQKCVRNLLKKINISIVEQNENFEKTKFCGTSLFNGPDEENNRLVPSRLGSCSESVFTSLSPSLQKQKMEAHCSHINTGSVLCYCATCTKGVEIGGKRAIHLLNLIYDKSNV